MGDSIWSAFDRIGAGWRAIQEQVPAVLADPRAYPREAMILAALAALVLLVILFAVFATQDAAKAARARRRLGRNPLLAKRLAIAAFVLSIVVLVVALAAVAPLTKAGSSLCTSCHAVERAAKAWRADAHSSVGCLRCHGDQGVVGAMEASVAGLSNLAGATRVGSGPRIPFGACLGCHEDLTSGVVVAQGVKVQHAEMIESHMDCGLCHVGVGHGGDDSELLEAGATAVRRSVMSRCITCHDGELASGRCATCHVDGPVDRVEASAPAGRTNAPLTCKGCHTSAVQKGCVDCHGLELPHPQNFMRKHAGMSNDDPALCAKCHETADRQLVCACHEETNEHGTYSEWFPRHGAAASAVNGGAGCRCHTPTFCSKCHDEAVMPPSVSPSYPAGL